ncbi:MAG: OpgC domain-containing protein [Verrucomicrobia bacterium]|nr:OpgC domain-containing protein [Verrucomicrobiota bacterium]
MKRLIELDILRGVLLVMMVVNHAPSPLRVFTDQPIGFFSTAEPFVFVSAFLSGVLFQRRTEKHGFEVARAATVSRAFRIYRAHLVTLLFAFVVGGVFLAEFPGIQNLLDQYFKNPGAAMLAAAALVFQPPLMDILPMYILFSLLTPCVFWAASRWGWKKVLFASVSCWFISQFRVREMFLASFKDTSFLNPGPFDLLSWQLLWVGGLFFGKGLQQKSPVLQLSALAEAALLALAIIFLGLRWYTIGMQIDPGKQFWILDKWHLGPLRVLNFFVTTWVIAKLLPALQRWEIQLRPLSAVGRNMLPVFCSEICLSLLLVAVIDPSKSHKPLALVLVLAQIVSIFLIAWLLEWRSAAKNNQFSKLSELLVRPISIRTRG